MFALISLAGNFTDTITQVIGNLGYLGIFLLNDHRERGHSHTERGHHDLWRAFWRRPGGIPHVILVAVIGSLGTGLGSSIGYWIGALGGKPFVDRYGKYFGVNPKKMVWAERWFCKYGESAVIFTRLLPVVRTIVNVPAGLLNMDFKKFIAYSMIGAFPWCLVLAFIGFTLGENWESIMHASHLLTLAVISLMCHHRDHRSDVVPAHESGHRTEKNAGEVLRFYPEGLKRATYY